MRLDYDTMDSGVRETYDQVVALYASIGVDVQMDSDGVVGWIDFKSTDGTNSVDFSIGWTHSGQTRPAEHLALLSALREAVERFPLVRWWKHGEAA